MPNVTARKSGDVTILDLTGRITIDGGDEQLREAVGSALAGGATKILVNMAQVKTIDSSGIGELVRSYSTTTSRGGKLKLVNLPPKVNDILIITRLITVFDVYDSEDEAVQAFA